MSAKVSVFQQDQINYHRKPSQRSHLAQTLIKTPKHNYYRGNNVYLLKNISKNKKHKNKIGLPPNKRYCLTPLARHIAIDLGIVIFGIKSISSPHNRFIWQLNFISWKV